MLVTPHDTLFKVLLSNPRRAAELLRLVLPPGVAGRIDWSTLRQQPGSFIDEELRGSHADLLFSAQTDGQTIEIYVLYEHQSTFDEWMPLRLLRYMVRIWEALRQASAGRKGLPVIFPVVLHHGEAPWAGSTEFAALFTASAEELPFVPRFRFVLDDLSAIDATELQARAVSACVRLVLAMLQAARTPEALAAVLGRLRGLLLEVMRQPGEHDAVGAIIRYCFEVYGADEYADPAIQALIEEIKERSEEDMETIAQMLERRGREAGERKGWQGSLLKALKARFGEVPPSVQARVEAADTAELQVWVDRLFTAGSIEALLDG